MKKTIVAMLLLLSLSLFAVIGIPTAHATTKVFPGGSVTTLPGVWSGGSGTIYDDTRVSFDVTKQDLVVTISNIDMRGSRSPHPPLSIGGPYVGWAVPLEEAGIQVGVTARTAFAGPPGWINPSSSAFYNFLIAGNGGPIGNDYYLTQAAYVDAAGTMYENKSALWDGNVLGQGFNTPYVGVTPPLGGYWTTGNAAFDTFDMQLTFHYLAGGDVLFTPLIRVHATTDAFSYPANVWLATFPLGKVFVIPGTAWDWTNVKPFVFVGNWGAGAGGGTITWSSVQADGSPNYYLTVNSVDPGTTVGQGWYPENTIANFHVTSPLYYDMVRKLICTGYHGDATGSGTSGTILMDNFHSVTFDWDTYWYITVTSAHDTPTPSDWVLDTTGSFTASVTSPADIVLNDHRWVCTGYTIDGGTPVLGPTTYTFTHVTGVHTIVFNWKEQFYLTVTSSYDSPTGAGYYDKGASATFSISPTATSGGVTYIFQDWLSSDPNGYTGPLTSTSVTMNNAITETAKWLKTPAPPSVGGEWAPITLQVMSPINAVQLVATWIALALIAAASAYAAYRRWFKKHW